MTGCWASTTRDDDLLGQMTFTPVIAAFALPQNQGVAVELDGRAIVLWRVGDQVFALDNLCPHFGSRLDAGRVKDGILACPLHGARFELATGRCRTPALGGRDVVAHAARIVDGQVEVALSPDPVTQPAV
jgi:3-phenylpropionate/trans-cinnamate dioxygenase ferredoxin subunit